MIFRTHCRQFSEFLIINFTYICLIIQCMKEEIKDIIAKEAEAVLQIPVGEGMIRAIELVFQQVHMKKGKIVASGMGKAGQIAENIATTFSSTGSPAVFLHPSNAQHGDLGVIQENDVLLCISNSGKTREIIELVDLARKLNPVLPFILISGNPDGQLVNSADAFIYTGGPKEVCPLGLTPTTSTTVMTVIGDVLVVSVMKRIGFTSDDYAKRHHGGYLGDKSRSQSTGNHAL